MKHKKQKSVKELNTKFEKEQKKRQELQAIREERKRIEQEETIAKPRKRAVELVEYEDGSFSLNGFAWNLPLQREELLDALESWVDGSLENGKPILFENEDKIKLENQIDEED